MRTFCAAYATIGGIKINSRTEALTETLDVIPGLYAAGDIVVGELFGNPPVLAMPGLDFALGTGRIAGKSVLAYLGRQ